MMRSIRVTLYFVARAVWLAYGVFLWAFWLASVLPFLQRAAAGTLPTTPANGFVPAQAAAEGAAAWGVSVAAWSRVNLAANGLSFLAFSLIALLIWWRVRTGFGLLTAFVLLVGGSASMRTTIHGAELSSLALTAWEVGAVIWPLFFLWLYLFPNGRAVPRRLLWILGPVLGLFMVSFLLSTAGMLLPEASTLARAAASIGPIASTLIAPLFLMVLGAQVYRYFRVSGAVEREQTKWFVFGLVVAFLLSVLIDWVADVPSEIGTLMFVALPLGIGISILRYRLFDIDVIIRKTLVYGALTALLALVYFGSIALLQGVVTSVSGRSSTVVIVLSTLAIAALFAPLRRRIQDVIDRRFYRRKYDAEQVLARFAQTARDETDLDSLTAELARVVQETMQPEQVSVWLRSAPTANTRSIEV